VHAAGGGLSSSAAIVCSSSLAVMHMHGIELTKGVSPASPAPARGCCNCCCCTEAAALLLLLPLPAPLPWCACCPARPPVGVQGRECPAPPPSSAPLPWQSCRRTGSNSPNRSLPCKHSSWRHAGSGCAPPKPTHAGWPAHPHRPPRTYPILTPPTACHPCIPSTCTGFATDGPSFCLPALPLPCLCPPACAAPSLACGAGGGRVHCQGRALCGRDLR
jgi:hypothetical protein